MNRFIVVLLALLLLGVGFAVWYESPTPVESIPDNSRPDIPPPERRNVSLEPLGTANTATGYYYMMSFTNLDDRGFHGKAKITLTRKDGTDAGDTKTLNVRYMTRAGEGQIAHIESTIPPVDVDPVNGVLGARYEAIMDGHVVAEGNMKHHPLGRTEKPFIPTMKVDWGSPTSPAP